MAETRNYRGALATVTTLFFMWGFLTSLNDILVPHLKSIFDLNYAEVMLIQFAFFSAYFIFSLPSGRLIDRIGYKKAMVAGLLTMGIGALLFIPAAAVPSFPLFLGALIILAAGITLLQVAANPYVTVLGPADTASSRLNLTQAFNSLGTTVAPYFGSLVILSAAPKTSEEMRRMSSQVLQAYRLHQASSVKLPYLGLGLALLLLGVFIAKVKLPAIPEAVRSSSSHTAGQSVWKYRHLVLGAVAIFVYVGAEVAIGSFLVSYLGQPSIGNLPANIAARFVSVYWGGAMIGRFIGSGVLQRVRTGAVLAVAAVGACLLVVISIATTGHVAMWTILLVGLCNSIMFPSIFALGVAGLGPLTGDGSGVLVMAIVGGAIIPEIQGALADHIGIHYALALPALCYIYILYYALRGSRPAATASA
ncbi:MAG TPA: sugar MFS transporter [Candidatus Acidoferrales bacterium]|nr:sugar MFS transporter [Candidatus Acidoferrales bacterium]